METILPKIMVDLGIAALAGALGSLGTTWLKSVFNTQNRTANAFSSLFMICLFSYIVTIYYGGYGWDTFVVVSVFANIDAKALYETAKRFTVEKEVTEEGL